jgi:hypothetical protein
LSGGPRDIHREVNQSKTWEIIAEPVAGIPDYEVNARPGIKERRSDLDYSPLSEFAAAKGSA